MLQSTIGTTEAKAVKASWTSQVGEWLRGFNLPILQLAHVAMMLLFAFLVLSQTVSADGSGLNGVYQEKHRVSRTNL